MQQIKYMCPLCKDENKPLIKIGISRNHCTICGRTFWNKEVIGWELNRTDFEKYWEERNNSTRTEVSYPLPLIEDILKKKSVDNQMDDIVQESTDNLMHEIIMVRIFDRRPRKVEEQAIKTKIDEIFDIILNRD